MEGSPNGDDIQRGRQGACSRYSRRRTMCSTGGSVPAAVETYQSCASGRRIGESIFFSNRGARGFSYAFSAIHEMKIFESTYEPRKVSVTPILTPVSWTTRLITNSSTRCDRCCFYSADRVKGR